MRVKLTPGFIDKAPLPEKGDRVFYWDSGIDDCKGKLTSGTFGLQVTALGCRSFVIQYRASGKERRMVLDVVAKGVNLGDARGKAISQLEAVKEGGDPLAERLAKRRKTERAESDTFETICKEYLELESKKKDKLRSLSRRAATLERLVYPKLGKLPIGDIGRGDIHRLLDQIECDQGRAMAGQTLAFIRKIMNWHEGRNDGFRPPITKDMSRKMTARDRTLTDDEIRALWKAADRLNTPFARMLQFILLTGTRRNEAAHMRRSEINGDDWTIPAERYKSKHDQLIFLTPATRAIIGKLPVIGRPDGFVFTANGERPISALAAYKMSFDEACGFTGWTIHDLRRTARSLMSRAGVNEDHAERALGHVIGGIRGVYDRHTYEAEKRRAFEALAAQIDRILNPPAENVVTLRSSAAPGVV
jgi:integrase